MKDGIGAGWRLVSEWARPVLLRRWRLRVLAFTAVVGVVSAGVVATFVPAVIHDGPIAGAADDVAGAVLAASSGVGIAAILAIVLVFLRIRRFERGAASAGSVATGSVAAGSVAAVSAGATARAGDARPDDTFDPPASPRASPDRRWRRPPRQVEVTPAARAAIRAAWAAGLEPDLDVAVRLAAAEAARRTRAVVPRLTTTGLAFVPVWIAGLGIWAATGFAPSLGIVPCYFLLQAGGLGVGLHSLGRTRADIETAPTAVPEHLEPDGRKKPDRRPRKVLGTDFSDYD
ncbi:hypothetical protein [Frondihabitans cladoniiphilus]|uniref:Uncharacterized protein n=1 Tax=Frondihabitans cladoniiphilus TaxID=715785 RepID=A0ABP8VRB5_9MICO